MEATYRLLLSYTLGRLNRVARLLRAKSILDTDDMIQEYSVYRLMRPDMAEESRHDYIALNMKHALVDALRKEVGRPERCSVYGSKRAMRFWGEHYSVEHCLELPDPRVEHPTDLPRAVAKAMARLPERLRFVLVQYYWRDRSLKEIGEELGVVESRVSQLRTEAMTRLRRYLPPKEDLL